MPKYLKLCPYLLMLWGAAAIPAYAATGKHIECRLEGVIKLQNGDHKDTSHTLNFYLDDANAKIVSESEVTVKTVSYSDTKIDAEIQDNSVAGGTLFGDPLIGTASLVINRVSGTVALGGRLANGADVEQGTCETVSAPKAKF